MLLCCTFVVGGGRWLTYYYQVIVRLYFFNIIYYLFFIPSSFLYQVIIGPPVKLKIKKVLTSSFFIQVLIIIIIIVVVYNISNKIYICNINTNGSYTLYYITYMIWMVLICTKQIWKLINQQMGKGTLQSTSLLLLNFIIAPGGRVKVTRQDTIVY